MPIFRLRQGGGGNSVDRKWWVSDRQENLTKSLLGQLVYAYPMNQPNEAIEKGGSTRELYGLLQLLLPQASNIAARA